MNSCKTCDWARRTGAKGYIACAYFFKEHEQDHEKTMVKLNIESIYTGWGYMRQRPGFKKGNTVGEGVMTNNVAIFEMDFVCSHHKEID